MPVYAAERELPGITLDQLANAQRAAIATSEQSTAEGKPVRYIRSMYLPGDARVTCLFEADDADAVRDVNERAAIPFTRIVEAMDLTP